MPAPGVATGRYVIGNAASDRWNRPYHRHTFHPGRPTRRGPLLTRHIVGNLLATVAAVLVGAATVYLSYTKLKVPQIPLDWAALIFSGLTTAIIAFFVVWGHFQKDPEIKGRP